MKFLVNLAAAILFLTQLSGCRQSASPTPQAIEEAEKHSVTYLQSLNAEDRKSYEDSKADWLKHLKDDATSFEKTGYPRNVLESQTILGRLGYGTLFTGVFDGRTREALLLYQKKNGIYQSGMVDPLTWFALGDDEKVLDDRDVRTGSFDFFAKEWSEYFFASGAWDYRNKDAGFIESSNIDCYKPTHTCTEADGMELVFGRFVSVQASTTDFAITQWNDSEIVAEKSFPCERDQIVIDRDERTVTMHMISTNPDNENCRKEMGDARVEDAHLMGSDEIGKAHREAIQKKRASLLQFSDTAARLFQEAK